MAWNSALPGNTEKIRDLGRVIRPNWEAIEEADETAGTPLTVRASQLADRSVVAVAADPVVVGATTYVYSKQDGGGVQECYVRDAAGNIVQMTNDGGLGAADMRVNFEDFTNDNGTTLYDERNLVGYWGRISAAGAISDSSGGFTVVRAADSRYDITFTTAQTSVNYGITLGTIAGGNPRIAVYTSVTAAGFRVQIVNQAGTFIAAGADFTFAIHGGRPT